MKSDYELFAYGNIVGVQVGDSKIKISIVDRDNQADWFKGYYNSNMAFTGIGWNFEIQWIVRLDDKGNVAERVFDRDRDMPKDMPKLEQGLMVEVETKVAGVGNKLGIVSGNKIVYSEGGWNYLDDFDDHGHFKRYDGYIVAIYKANDFNFCDEGNCIWERKDV